LLQSVNNFIVNHLEGIRNTGAIALFAAAVICST